MKKIIISTALLLAMIFSLASCSFGGGLKTKSILVTENYEAPVTLKTSEKVTALNGKTLSGGDTSYYNLILFSNEDDYFVFNALTGQNVKTLDKDDEPDIILRDAYFTVAITDDDETTTTLYDANGNELASYDGEVAASRIANDLIVFDDKVYRVDYETLAVTLVKTYGPFEKRLDDLYSVGEYYYYAEDDGVVFEAYDLKLALVGSWTMPFDFENAEDYELYPLSNGNIIAQVIEALPDSFEEFSYLEDGRKMLVTTYLIETDGDYKKLKADYVIDDVEPSEDDDIFNSKKVNNLAWITNFEDGRLGAASRLVAISDKGAVSELFTDLDELGEADDFYQINDKVFIYSTNNGNRYFIDAEGNIIGDVTGLISYSITESFFVCDGVSYDYNLNKLLDLDADGYEVYATLNNSVILYKAEEEEFYLYNGSAAPKLIDVESIATYGDSYYVTLDDDTYTVYNDLGEKLFSTSDTSMPRAIYTDYDNGYVIFAIRDSEGDYTYYKVK